MDMTPREPVVVNGFANEPPSSIVTVAKIVYILHAVSVIIGIVTGASVIGAFLFGWPSIAAVVLNYVMRSEARGTYVDSHFSWQIRTFWYGHGLDASGGLYGAHPLLASDRLCRLDRGFHRHGNLGGLQNRAGLDPVK